MREALRVLEANGVVRSGPGDPNGPDVLPFTPTGLAKQTTRLAQVAQMSTAGLIAFRMILDASANLLAARLHSEEELATMERTLVVMEEAIEPKTANPTVKGPSNDQGHDHHLW